MQPRQLALIRSALSYLEIGQWLHSSASGGRPKALADDFALFDFARTRITGERPLYLEFGVFEGRTLRWWAHNLPHSGARFVGFDSFEGLPEDWRPGVGVGSFRTGAPPKIDDARVSFQVGWFEDTLSSFAIPDHDQLVINIDSDLYSSARTVLRWAGPYLHPGTLIYFDEFSDRDHEMRALFEFLEDASLTLIPVGYAAGGQHWLFEVCGHTQPTGTR